MSEYDPRVGDFVWLYKAVSLRDYGISGSFPAIISRIHPSDERMVDVVAYSMEAPRQRPDRWADVHLVHEGEVTRPKSGRYALWSRVQVRLGRKQEETV